MARGEDVYHTASENGRGKPIGSPAHGAELALGVVDQAAALVQVVVGGGHQILPSPSGRGVGGEGFKFSPLPPGEGSGVRVIRYSASPPAAGRSHDRCRRR